jgi:hypothetical protein
MDSDAPRPIRADAQRNRDRTLDIIFTGLSTGTRQ